MLPPAPCSLAPPSTSAAGPPPDLPQALVAALKAQQPTDAAFVAPRFDFAALPRPIAEMAPMLAYIRSELPRAEIYFHHGETTGVVPFEAEVAGAAAIVPHVDRIGHAMCLGLAAQGKPEGAPPALAAAAAAALRAMARRGVGVEVCPIGNAMLNSNDLSYYAEFAARGVELYVGTDDPGFTGCNLEGEVAAVRAALGAA